MLTFTYLLSSLFRISKWATIFEAIVKLGQEFDSQNKFLAIVRGILCDIPELLTIQHNFVAGMIKVRSQLSWKKKQIRWSQLDNFTPSL